MEGLCAEKGEAAEGGGAETLSVEDSLEDDDRSMNDVVDDSRSFEGILEAVRCWLAAYDCAELGVRRTLGRIHAHSGAQICLHLLLSEILAILLDIES